MYSSELLVIIMSSSGKIRILTDTFRATSTEIQNPDPIILGEPHAPSMACLESNVSALHGETSRCIRALNDARRTMLEHGDLLLTMMDYRQGELYRKQALANPSGYNDKIREAILEVDVDRQRIMVELNRKARAQSAELARMMSMSSEECGAADRRIRADGLFGFHKTCAIQDGAQQGHEPATSHTGSLSDVKPSPTMRTQGAGH